MQAFLKFMLKFIYLLKQFTIFTIFTMFYYFQVYTHTHTYIYIYIFQILFSHRLLQDIEYISLCYIVGL